MKIITHDGQFHPDEIFAIVLLQHFFSPHVDVVRTRDEEALKEAMENPDIFVVDVGFQCDYDMKNFDHHFSEFKKMNSRGNMMSSCGLVWDYIKDSYLVRSYCSDHLIYKIEEFCDKIDRQDNGVDYFPEVSFISSFNNYSEYHKVNFEHAFDAAANYFQCLMNAWTKQDKNNRIMQLALKEAKDGIIFCEEHISVTKLANATDNKLIVSPRKEGEWSIVTLNEGLEIDFSSRCPAPLSWRGHQKEKLQGISGFPQLEFCHKTGFMSIVHGTKEEALEVAKYIIEIN